MISRLVVTSLLVATVCAFVTSPATNINDGKKIFNFLQSIPASARSEMEEILKNKDLTRTQIEQKLDAWAAKQPGNFPQQYNEIKKLLNSGLKSSASKASNAIEKQIMEIRNNKSLTLYEERKAILDIIAREPPSDEEIESFVFPDNLDI